MQINLSQGRNIKKLMIVSWPIKPGRGGSVIIMERLAEHFNSKNMVLFGELPVWGSAPARPTDKPQSHYFRSGITLFGRGARYFAWLRWLLFPLLVRKIVRTIQREKCDYVLGVFPDEYYCYAACLAAEKLGLGFSTYFHNTYLDNAAVDQSRGATIQPKLFGNSEVIFVMNDGMKEFYEQKYGLKKVVSLVHTFASYPDLPPAVSSAMQPPVKLALIGNFNASNFEATIRFINAVNSTDRYKVFMYTHVPLALLRMRGLDTSRIEHLGYIDDSKLIMELQKYDITVITHGFVGEYGPVEYKTIFPTRTIPFLLSGKPIFVHAPRESFVSDFFEKTQAGCLVTEPTEEAVLAGLARIADDPNYAGQLLKSAKSAAARFFAPKVVALLRHSINFQVD